MVIFMLERLKISEVEMKSKYTYLIALGLISFPLLSQAYQQKVYTSNSSPIDPTKAYQTSQVANDIQAEDAKAQLNKVDHQVQGEDTDSVAQAAHGMD